jgi:hypothetical protein
MGANLIKKVATLEADLWAKAKEIKEPFSEEISEFYEVAWPLDADIFDAWLACDREAEAMHARILRMEKAMPPIHPAFLPGSEPMHRNHQWGLHQSRDYRELSEQIWRRFIEHVNTTYDLSAGRVAVALRLFRDDIDRDAKQAAYIGESFNPEVAAEFHIEVLEGFCEKCFEAGDSTGQETRERLWGQAFCDAALKMAGRPMTEADFREDQEMWRRINEDMAAGLPSDQSEAVAYFRAIYTQYPLRGARQ